MKLVLQANPFDCGIACLAMMLDIPYQTVKSLIGRDVTHSFEEQGQEYHLSPPYRVGVTPEEVSSLLFSMDIVHGVFEPKEAYSLHPHHPLGRKWLAIPDLVLLPTAKDIEGMINHPSNRSMLGVEAKDSPTSLHWICVEGGEVFDPGSCPYTSGDELKVLVAIVAKGLVL